MSFGSTPAATTQPPRVFISWSHEPDPHSEAAVVHQCRVLALADQLRAGGVDAQLDLYDPHPPECTTTYLKRWKGELVDGKGLGVRWEGLNLRNLLYREPARQSRVIPILFEGASPSDIPLEVAGASWRRLPTEYDDLYRHLTNQPAISKPALGQLRRAVDNIPAPAHEITGREEELALIDAGLARGGATALVQAISGLGGVGKTRIALEYAHTRAAHYELRWWAYAHRLDNDLAELARALGIVATDDDIDRAAKAARAYLRNHSRWLLVIDNADDPEQLRPLLPTLGPGHVLITSRAAAWHGAATPIEINVLPADVARQLLLDRSRRPDDGHAADVARSLGYLPLALVQAAAYLENSRDTFADYLAILRSDGLDLFDDPLSDAHDPLHGDPADAHRRTVVLAGARDLFARSFAIAEDLAKADPHPAQAQRDPSVSLGQLGVVEVQAGNVACARDLFAIAEDLAKADPHSAEAQRDLSVSPERLGSVEVQAGNLAGARDLLVRSLSLREDLVTPRRRSATSRSLARKWPRSIIRRRLHGYPAT